MKDETGATRNVKRETMEGRQDVKSSSRDAVAPSGCDGVAAREAGDLLET